MLQLPVPYRSQWDADARRYTPDCGPTCVSMILNYLGVILTPDELYDVTAYSEPSKYTTITELRKAGDASGVAFPFQRYGATQREALAKLRENLDHGRPIIALVKYAPWIRHTSINYGGGHFVVVTGYDDGRISFHDPLFSASRRELGAHFTLATDAFCAGWGGFRSGENPNWAFLAPGIGGEISEAEEIEERTVPIVPPEIRRRIETLAIFDGVQAPEWSDADEVEAWVERLGDWAATYDEYTVRPGDSLSALAHRYYGDGRLWPVIQAYNGLQRDRLLIDEPLLIPHVDAGEMMAAMPRGVVADVPDEVGEEAIDYGAMAEYSVGIGYEPEPDVTAP